MMVKIQHLECGGPSGALISCDKTKIFYPFCKEYGS